MDNPRKKPIIGILGGIGAGKSTVATEFAKLGCETIDADKIAHELLDEPAVKQSVVSLFGEDILSPAREIDRKKLADTAFADAEKLTALNEIIHPLVLAQVEQLIEQYNHQNKVKAITLDMPLLCQVGWEKRCDRLIFVDCDLKLRAERAKKTHFLDENQLEIRENFQISLDSKARLSDNRVDNNSDFSGMAKQVTKIFSDIVGN